MFRRPGFSSSRHHTRVVVDVDVIVPIAIVVSDDR
jgi:hypothetical protein|tara:strand:+ start:120 stop:224 length:105 start_codon:yes stop_codon:yes gene_type:complete